MWFTKSYRATAACLVLGELSGQVMWVSAGTARLLEENGSLLQVLNVGCQGSEQKLNLRTKLQPWCFRGWWKMILVILKESKKEGRKMGRRGEGKGEGKEGGREGGREKKKGKKKGRKGKRREKGGRNKERGRSKQERGRQKEKAREKSVVYRSQLLGPWRQRPLILLLYACNPTAPTGTGTTECWLQCFREHSTDFVHD